MYDRKSRFAGETHYSLSKMFLFSLDAITSFSILPLRLLSLLGLLIVFLATLFSFYVLIVKIFDPGFFLAGFPTIVLLISFSAAFNCYRLGSSVNMSGASMKR